MSELVFLKLGGSLITDKTRPYTVRLDKLAKLTAEIASALGSTPGLTLLLGHGSGSFGHTAAKRYGTREGMPGASGAESADREYWRGFAEVHFRAAQLNAHVMDALQHAGLPALAFPPSASLAAREGQIINWDLTPIRDALRNHLLPVVYGDVAFDDSRGGTIVSTEDVFEYLARDLSPARILLAGLEPGVWEDFPNRTRVLPTIRPQTYEAAQAGIRAAAAVDVTGGMQSKVRQMLALAGELGLSAQIFSGEEPGNVQQALMGKAIGTIITA